MATHAAMINTIRRKVENPAVPSLVEELESYVELMPTPSPSSSPSA
jgi:hypothetical protein